MLPPVMDVFVVWHPDDRLGRQVGDALVDHFHGTAFSGLIGGAVEVYVRSAGWGVDGSAPRPLPTPSGRTTGSSEGARFVAVVPVMSRAMAQSVSDRSPWSEYVRGISRAQRANPHHFAYFPVTTSRGLEGSTLAEVLGERQRVGHIADENAAVQGAWRRDLVQGLTQFIQGPSSRIRVFISHTRQAVSAGAAVAELTALVRAAIANSRLREFFDAHDLQPGENWAQMLREAAGGSALLALRSDLYSSRAWCQEEVWTAKIAGVPVVALDALDNGEERGSFLMDHVPRVPVRRDGDSWSRAGVDRALSLLVDEALKRALWKRQRELAEETQLLKVSWWAPHAPEPITLASWLDDNRDTGIARGDGPVLILHPDPPLGGPELDALEQLARLAGVTSGFQVVTPGQLDSRTG